MALTHKYPTVQAVKSLHIAGEWSDYFEEGDPTTLEKDYIKVEGELAKIKRSVRKQIEKAKVFIERFDSDLEIRRFASDAPPELLAMWEDLERAYQAENAAEEKVQDCLEKSVVPFLCSTILIMQPPGIPKISELIRQAKQCMDAKVNFPAVFERLGEVTELDTERKELQKIADDAKATRLEAQKKLTIVGAALDPAYVPAPRRAPPECY